jgi:hypothetical protein
MNLKLLDPKLIMLARRSDSGYRGAGLAVCTKTQEYDRRPAAQIRV